VCGFVSPKTVCLSDAPHRDFIVIFTGAQKLNLKAATLPRLLGEVL